MNYRFAVCQNTFICYDQRGEVSAYLHELPLEILSLDARGKRVIITARYAWTDIPPKMKLFLRTSRGKKYPKTAKKDPTGILLTYILSISEKPVSIRAFLEYSHMTAVIPVRFSKTVKKNIRIGFSTSNGRLVLWHRSLLKTLKSHLPSSLIRR